jgi:hypothetical protein
LTKLLRLYAGHWLVFDLARLDAGETLMQIAPNVDRAPERRAMRQTNEQGPGADHGATIPPPRGRRRALIAPFPIDDVPERPALEIDAQIIAEDINAVTKPAPPAQSKPRRDIDKVRDHSCICQ